MWDQGIDDAPSQLVRVPDFTGGSSPVAAAGCRRASGAGDRDGVERCVSVGRDRSRCPLAFLYALARQSRGPDRC